MAVACQLSCWLAWLREISKEKGIPVATFVRDVLLEDKSIGGVGLQGQG